MAGVVMKDDQLLGLGLLAEPHALFPGGVAPIAVFGELLVGIGAVVDYQIGALDELQDVAIRLAFQVLGVGDVADRVAAIVDPIAGGPIGMIERGGAALWAIFIGAPRSYSLE